MHPGKILMVDDDHDHLLICAAILKRNGYEVKTLPGCENYEDLLRAVETFDPALIFMDHDMKGLCGIDLTKWLKCHLQYSAIPVIYFTGRDDILKLAQEAGANDHLRKPFEPDDLVQISRRYLTHSV